MLRPIRVLVIAASTAATLAVPSAAGAAKMSDTAPNCEEGNNIAYFSPGFGQRSDPAFESLDKVYFEKCEV